MSSLRQKAKTKGLGSTPPSWVYSGLGRADNDPDYILGGLGLLGFQGRGDDWMQDIHDLLLKAVRSRILDGLFSEPTIFRDRNMVAINGASDLYGYSSTTMMRMIRSILWAAEQRGKIAMPSKLKTATASGGSVVTIGL